MMGHSCNSQSYEKYLQNRGTSDTFRSEDKLIIVVSVTRPMLATKSIKHLLQEDVMQQLSDWSLKKSLDD